MLVDTESSRVSVTADSIKINKLNEVISNAAGKKWLYIVVNKKTVTTGVSK